MTLDDVIYSETLAVYRQDGGPMLKELGLDEPADVTVRQVLKALHDACFRWENGQRDYDLLKTKYDRIANMLNIRTGEDEAEVRQFLENRRKRRENA